MLKSYFLFISFYTYCGRETRTWELHKEESNRKTRTSST